MQSIRIKAALLLIYFIFAMLLNSVGIVILQVIQNFQVSKEAASVLEGFKDLPIAIVSFLVASALPKLGYKKALQIALLLIAGASVLMPLFPSFDTSKLLFFCVGVAFALTKVSVYATLGLITKSKAEHASVLNFIEGFFMLGVLTAYWFFAAFMTEGSGNGWLDVYWYLAGLSLLAFALVSSTDFPALELDPQSTGFNDFIAMLKLTAKPLVFVFVISAFLYVLIEQGIGSWLPTFNNEVLHLPSQLSVQITSIFAASLAAGRLSAGFVLRFIPWHLLCNICLLAMAALVLLTLPLTHEVQPDPNVTLWTAPLSAYLLPLIGFFMAPIYPMLNSAILTSLPQQQHAAMTGLIVVFSALGGTTGSIVTGHSFAALGGQTAFYLTLLPLSLLLLSSNSFHKLKAAA